MNDKQASGWTIFAGTILFIVGCLNIVYGLAALLNDQIITTTANGVLIFDFTTWGWVTLILGALLVLTAMGLWAVQTWALMTAVVLATINAIAQVGLMTVFPLWSILIVALNIAVIYNITVKGGVVERPRGEREQPPRQPTAAH